MKGFYCLFLIGTSFLFARIEDSFKQAPNKSNCHTMRNVDFIYMLNLDQRPEKFARCTNQLHPFGIYPYRFSAVNGWELPLETINSLGVHYAYGMPQDLWGTAYFPENKGEPHHEIMSVDERNYYCHSMSRGAIGIVLSHLSILQDAFDAGYETIWVMEDDIQLIQNPHLISDLIERLDSQVGKSWDILFTDRDTKNDRGEYVPCLGFARRPNFSPENQERFFTRTDISADFSKVGARYGAYSMIVRRSGMKKILDFIKSCHVFLPYDMDFFLPNDISLYAVNHDVVSFQVGSPSDNGGPNYLNCLDE